MTFLSDPIDMDDLAHLPLIYANWPTVSVITASAKPTLATSRKGTSTALTGWTTAIAADDVLRIGVNSVTGMQRVVLVVKVRRG